MRMQGLTLLIATAALVACAGPTPPGSETALAYRTGSRLPQPNVAQPDMTYYNPEQLGKSPDQTIGRVIEHAVPTAVPPADEQPGQ